MSRLALVFVAFGCAPVYTKPALNAPFFKGAGDIQIAAHGGINGVDIQLAAAPTDFLGVIAAASTDDEGSNRHLAFEGGLGYYLPFATYDRGRLDLLVGGGWGRSEGEGQRFLDSGRIRASGEYALAFFQGDVGFGSKYVDAGFAGRVAYVRYIFDDGGSGTANVVFFEPGVFVRAGYKFIKAEFQIAGVLPVGDTQDLHWVPLHASAGLRFNLGEILFEFYGEEDEARRLRRERRDDYEEDWENQDYDESPGVIKPGIEY